MAATFMADAATIPTDALVIGAGPVGLFQVFQLGLLEIQAHVVDALPYAGGQPVELYPDKPIYDIPAIAVCTGRELSERLLEQIRPFGATFHLGQEVTSVQRRDDGCFDVETSRGTRFLARTIFLAAGVGAFQPRLLRVDGLDRFRDTQLHYGVAAPQDFTGQHLVVVGGGDSALDWAIRFASDAQCQAASVTLVHRRDAFQAAPATIAKLRELRDAGRIRFVAGQITSHEEQEGRLAAAVVNDPDGQDIRLPLDHLLVFFGLSPKLGPIADWGLDIERKQVRVDTETFATSIPGIFAVGDINTYPGKKKLIVCGFHECVLAAYGAAAMVFPDKPVQLQYTTTSTRLHQVLGVQSPSAD